MISEQQQEQASLYVVGALTADEQRAFEAALRGNAELLELVRSLQRAAGLMAQTLPQAQLPMGLKQKVMAKIGKPQAGRAVPSAPPSNISGGLRTARPTITGVPAGLQFLEAAAQKDWKQLPVPGAFIKLLSIEKERGYAVLLGKIEAGVRYPAHENVGPEDFYILSGDLAVGDRKLVAGDFHHADKGSKHEVNYSVEGCTLLAVLTTDDPLVAFAMA
jgi:anti-sigma factor ChrR (cupin superfamily)